MDGRWMLLYLPSTVSPDPTGVLGRRRILLERHP